MAALHTGMTARDGEGGGGRASSARGRGRAWRRGWAAAVVAGALGVGTWWWSDPQAAASQSHGGAALSRGGQADPRAGELGQSRVMPYPMEQVWPTAVRYLRVDRGYTIVDKDADAGFILFDFPIGPDDRTGRGSVEVFATKDASGRPSASVNVTTDGGPLHLPHAIIEGLGDKLRRERGQPAAPPRPAPDAPDQPKDKPKDKPKGKPEPEPPEDDGLIVDG